MKNQVKSRMEVLLQQEIEARQLSSTTTGRVDETRSSSGQTSLTSSGQTSKTGFNSTTTQDAASERSGSKVNAKADLIFNLDSGKNLHVTCYY